MTIDLVQTAVNLTIDGMIVIRVGTGATGGGVGCVGGGTVGVGFVGPLFPQDVKTTSVILIMVKTFMRDARCTRITP